MIQPTTPNLIMKTLAFITALCLAASSGFAASRSDFVVHEWGTFTSVQGGDGVLLPWQPNIAPDLPKFVYNWQRPGFGHQSPMLILKGGIRSLQRMETPVIYFYSDRELTADVTVKFPDGFITEWYPQAQQIGSTTRKPLTSGTNLMVFGQSFTNGMIGWRNLRILPASSPGLAAQLPTDNSDNHYFAARETDSSFVRVEAGGTNGTTPELERLLFYRGTGNFGTPLKVTVSDDGQLSLANTGPGKLTGLFLIEMHGGAGKFTQLDKLQAGAQQSWVRLESQGNTLPMAADVLRERIAEPMAASLVKAGLYPREAKAMVKTWSKSWFAEDGVRVLYILPQAWTNKTLPITLNPTPQELVRVMVGRAEIITPALQNELAGEIAKARSGDKSAEQRMQGIAKKLGRFYGPAHQLASQRLPVALNNPVAATTFE